MSNSTVFTKKAAPLPVVQPWGKEHLEHQGQQEANTHCQVGVLVPETVAAAVPSLYVDACAQQKVTSATS